MAHPALPSFLLFPLMSSYNIKLSFGNAACIRHNFTKFFSQDLGIDFILNIVGWYRSMFFQSRRILRRRNESSDNIVWSEIHGFLWEIVFHCLHYIVFDSLSILSKKSTEKSSGHGLLPSLIEIKACSISVSVTSHLVVTKWMHIKDIFLRELVQYILVFSCKVSML